MQDASEELGRPLTAGSLSVEDVAVETSLRPRYLAEYIGQQSVKQNLEILLAAAVNAARRQITSFFTGRPAWARRRSPTSSPASSV